MKNIKKLNISENYEMRNQTLTRFIHVFKQQTMILKLPHYGITNQGKGNAAIRLGLMFGVHGFVLSKKNIRK